MVLPDDTPSHTPLVISEEDAILQSLRSELSLPPSSIPITVRPGETLLDKIPSSIKLQEEEDIKYEMGDVFKAIVLIIPFSFLYLAMDIMIHQQYSQHPSIEDEFWRLVNAVPLLSLIIYYSECPRC
ncbi:hypothetical protein BDY24DRAFT_403136 [Mrakia frigida]|uniref:uncharacterized protein n=1 Tax=Mrakia frigida TaxID=29902 RepID=UPI003FCC01E4